MASVDCTGTPAPVTPQAGEGVSARVLQFPTQLSSPVTNPAWRGRYPRGVVSLRRARDQRSCAERGKSASQCVRCRSRWAKRGGELDGIGARRLPF
jgi:hypothetical protein